MYVYVYTNTNDKEISTNLAPPQVCSINLLGDPNTRNQRAKGGKLQAQQAQSNDLEKPSKRT